MQENQNTSLPNNFSAANPGKPNRSKKDMFVTYKKPLIAAGIILTLLLAIWGVYSTGHSKGYDKGYNKGKVEAETKARIANPLGALSEANRNYWSIVGTVEAVDGNTVTVKNNKGKVEKATFTDDLEVSQKSNKNGANKSSLKVGQNVIVIGQKNDGKLTASRVTIKE